MFGERQGAGIGARGGGAFTGAAHGVWWMVLGLGLGIAALGLLSTGRWARGTAARAAALFEGVDTGQLPAADHGGLQRGDAGQQLRQSGRGEGVGRQPR